MKESDISTRGPNVLLESDGVYLQRYLLFCVAVSNLFCDQWEKKLNSSRCNPLHCLRGCPGPYTFLCRFPLHRWKSLLYNNRTQKKVIIFSRRVFHICTEMPIVAFSSSLCENKRNSSDKMLPPVGIEPGSLIASDSESNTILSTWHVLLKRSLNFCSCTTWYLDYDGFKGNQ